MRNVDLTFRSRRGFTLIELMIVVAIIGILAVVATPKFADLICKSKEAAVKGNLGTVRSALAIYYGDTEGNYPVNLFVSLATGPKYVHNVDGVPSLGKYEIPNSIGNETGHVGGQYRNLTAPSGVNENYSAGATAMASAGVITDDTPLIYFSTGSTLMGEVFVNCSHSDSKGNFWTSY